MSTNSTVRVCSFQGCGRKCYAKGFCEAHYKQNKTGRPLQPITIRRPGSACAFPGCDRTLSAKGFCKQHYKQNITGRALFPINSTQRPAGSPPRIEYDEAPCPNPELVGPCHIFRGYKNPEGYGKVGIGYKVVSVHKFVWEQTNGPVPEGLEIDHRCRNRSCCNIDHLRVVTHQVNTTENVVGSRWQLNAAKTHCLRGHPFDETNTYRYSKNGRRACRTCMRERARGVYRDDEYAYAVEHQEELLKGAKP